MPEFVAELEVDVSAFVAGDVVGFVVGALDPLVPFESEVDPDDAG